MSDRNPTVREVIEQYLHDLEVRVLAGTYSTKGLESRRHYLGCFVATYGDNRVSDCKARDITRWLLAHPERKSKHSQADAAGSVVTCFRWAAREAEIIDVCPYHRPKHLASPSAPRPALTREQFLAIRLQARTLRTATGKPVRMAAEFRAIFRFLWATGCRTCEARESLWEQVDWQREVIVMERHKTERATGRPRLIPICRVMRLLRWLHARRRTGQRHIFGNALGTPWSRDRLAKVFREFADAAGLPLGLSAYCARHGLCVRLLELGVGERQIANVLGHTTSRYISLYGQATRMHADHLNSVLKGLKG
jgi:integrase